MKLLVFLAFHIIVFFIASILIYLIGRALLPDFATYGKACLFMLGIIIIQGWLTAKIKTN